MNWPYAAFEIPEEIYAGWRAGNTGLVREEQWNRLFDKYADAYPKEAAELTRRSHGVLPKTFADDANAYIAKLQSEGPVVASRKASQMAIEAFAPLLPELIGGSADLAHSNLTLWKGSKSVASTDADANYVYYGVREFGMSAISNGLALHGGFLPYDATFLVFSDYCRNAIRMSALQRARVEDMAEKDIAKEIKRLEKLMLEHARSLEFEKAARVRDELALLKQRAFGASGSDNVVALPVGKP